MSVHVIYASTSGNVEIVVEKIVQILREAQIPVEAHRAEQTPLGIISSNDTFIFATSTWEHGQINPFFNRLMKEMKGHNFAVKRAAFVGLGDIRYEHVLFNQGLKVLRGLWLDQGGTEFHRQLLINGEPYHVLDTTVAVWAEALKTLLQSETSHD